MYQELDTHTHELYHFLASVHRLVFDQKRPLRRQERRFILINIVLLCNDR